MEPFRSHPGFQTTIFLAGCILSCLSQLVPAQENLTVVSVPEYPIEGQSVLLNAKNIQEGFSKCEWTPPFGGKIILTNSQVTPNNPQDVELHRNCSLTIKNLKSTNKGTYTVKVTSPPAKQSEGSEILIGSIYLILCDGKQIRIDANPPNPRVGQNVILTPKGIPGNYDFCQWKQKSQTGAEKIFEDLGQGSKEQQNQQQMVKQGCSLHLTQLTQDDSGSYSIFVGVSSDQNSAKENREKKCYRSQTQLKLEKSGSASVKYSAGIIAGALLGSLTWTSSLSLVPLLFGMLSSSFPKC